MSKPTAELEASLSALVERREDVAAALTQLDKLLAEHFDTLPARLVHFLERRSYQKALAFIREGDTGHHP